jgi:triosephosphate isomerase
MRRPIVAGNWKMNKTTEEAEGLARAVVGLVAGIETVDVVLCPTFTSLGVVHEVVSGTSVGLGGQNMHWEVDGAFTGEISPAMLLTSGCQYVILGHSERRTYFGETDATVNQRFRAAVAAGLIPIVCVGETLEGRQSEVTEQVVRGQISGAFGFVDSGDAKRSVVAYEPVWSIGTGLTATPEQAEEVHAIIRDELGKLYDEALADEIRIQYGGSVKPENAADLFSRPNIDGGLIGAAALDAESFAGIVKAAG